MNLTKHALMAGGAIGAMAAGAAYLLLLPWVMAPAPPLYPRWPAYGIYLLPACLLLIGAILAYLARGGNP